MEVTKKVVGGIAGSRALRSLLRSLAASRLLRVGEVLTRRERIILDLRQEGCSVLRIAETLVLKPSTVQRGLDSAIDRLGRSDDGRARVRESRRPYPPIDRAMAAKELPRETPEPVRMLSDVG